MLEFRTPGFKGFNVKYSPFFDNKLAVATGQNYGLVGNGRLYILELTPNGIVCERYFDTQDTLYDLTFSELHSSRLLTSSGDGSLKLFDLSIPTSTPYPIATWRAHGREVFACGWNLQSKIRFLSASWDGCVKIFDPDRDDAIVVLPTATCTYSAQWSPHEDGVVSAVGSDGILRLFDLRTPASAQNHLVMSVPIQSPPRGVGVPPPAMQNGESVEALTHDWNKYRSSIVAIGGVDRMIRTFDVRNAGHGPVAVLPGHEYAVRRVAWSPHLPDLLLSASYDMSCRVWTDGSAVGVDNRQMGQQKWQDAMTFGGGKELGRMDRHTEFANGVDWCLFGAEGWCASTAWDERVLVWDVRAVMGR